MCDQQRLRSACAHAQSDQSLCKSPVYSMIVKLLTEQHLEFLRLKEAAQARIGLHLSKCHIVGIHMSRLNYNRRKTIGKWLKSFFLTFLLSISTTMQVAPTQLKIMTLCVRFPEATLYSVPLARWYIVLITHGRPRPRNTLTLLLPEEKT